MKTFFKQYESLFQMFLVNSLESGGRKLENTPPTAEEILKLTGHNKKMTEEMRSRFKEFLESIDIDSMDDKQKKAFESIVEYVNERTNDKEDKEHLEKLLSKNASIQLGKLKRLIESAKATTQATTQEAGSLIRTINSMLPSNSVGEGKTIIGTETTQVVEGHGLSDINTEAFGRTLKVGAKWSDVEQLQKFLCARLEVTEDIDGIFGPKTKKLLQDYQRKIWMKNPDWILTISPTRVFETCRNIMNDVEKAKGISFEWREELEKEANKTLSLPEQIVFFFHRFESPKKWEIKYLQESINSILPSKKLSEDGIMWPNTISAYRETLVLLRAKVEGYIKQKPNVSQEDLYGTFLPNDTKQFFEEFVDTEGLLDIGALLEEISSILDSKELTPPFYEYAVVPNTSDPTVSELAKSILDASSADEDTSPEVINGNVFRAELQRFTELQTKENFGGLLEDFWWDEIPMKEIREEVNMKSLTSILSRLDLNELSVLYGEINLNRNHSMEQEDWSYSIAYYRGVVGSTLEKYWYESRTNLFKLDVGLWNTEIAYVAKIIEGAYNTRTELPKMLLEDQIRLLFDFNKDGVLDLGKNNYVWEAQINFHSFDSLTTDWADALVKNLGLWDDYSEFYEKMAKNIFAAREEFREALQRTISSGEVNIVQLLKEGWVDWATDKMYTKERRYAVEGLTDEVYYAIEERTNLYEREGRLKELSSLEGVSMEVLKDHIKQKSADFLIGLNSLWVSADLNIEKLDLFFDKLQIGAINGVPWISVSRDLYEDNWIELTWSQAYLVIPIMSISAQAPFDIDKFKELYPYEIEGTSTVSFYSSISPLWVSWGFNLEQIDEDASKWIEIMVEEMEGILKLLAKDIKSWNSFEETAFYAESKDKDADAKVYNQMKSYFDTHARDSSGNPTLYSDIFLKKSMESYLTHYKNQLFINANGLKTNEIWAWFLLLANILPIPYFNVGWEHISTDRKAYLNPESKVYKEWIDANTLGIEEVKYKSHKESHKVIKIPNAGLYGISNSLWKTQAEKDDKGNLYISWDLLALRIHEHTTHEWVYRTVVIAWWETDDKGMYIPTEITNITSSVNSWASEAMDISVNDLEAVKSTETLRKNLFAVMQYDALNHKETVGMQKLQKMIFDYKNESELTIEEVWDQFKLVVNHPWFMKYAKEKNAGEQLVNLIASLSSVKTDSEKVIAVQSISANLMKKKWLQDPDGDWVIKMKGGEKGDINEYEDKHDRANFFNGIFKESLPNMASAIADARKTWYEKNGDAKEYNLKPVNDGSMALAWVQSKISNWDINVQWVMPFSWAYNIVSVAWGVDFVDISRPVWESAEVEIVDSIPDRFLNSMMIALNKNWAGLWTVQDVKDFINAWWKGDIKIDYKLAFAKMWECLNDAVVIRDLSITVDWRELQVWATTTGEVYAPEHNVINWSLAFAWKIESSSDDGDSNSANSDNQSQPPNASSGRSSIGDIGGTRPDFRIDL